MAQAERGLVILGSLHQICAVAICILAEMIYRTIPSAAIDDALSDDVAGGTATAAAAKSGQRAPLLPETRKQKIP